MITRTNLEFMQIFFPSIFAFEFTMQQDNDFETFFQVVSKLRIFKIER